MIMKHLDDTQIYEIEAGRELEDIDYYESIACLLYTSKMAGS